MPSTLPSNLPFWPRWLNKELAALYTGRVGKDGQPLVRKFLKEVGKKWPLPGDKQGNEKYWDRLAIDQASDSLSGSDHVTKGAEQELLKWSQPSN